MADLLKGGQRPLRLEQAVSRAMDEWAKQNIKKSRVDAMDTLVEICKGVIDKAVAGDLGAAKEIFDRIDGKAKTKIEQTGFNNGIEKVIVQFVAPPEHLANRSLTNPPSLQLVQTPTFPNGNFPDGEDVVEGELVDEEETGTAGYSA